MVKNQLIVDLIFLIFLVLDSVMNFICERSGKWSNKKVTIFQFVSFFNNKQIGSFLENMSHEGFFYFY